MAQDAIDFLLNIYKKRIIPSIIGYFCIGYMEKTLTIQDYKRYYWVSVRGRAYHFPCNTVYLLPSFGSVL